MGPHGSLGRPFVLTCQLLKEEPLIGGEARAPPGVPLLLSVKRWPLLSSPASSWPSRRPRARWVAAALAPGWHGFPPPPPPRAPASSTAWEACAAFSPRSPPACHLPSPLECHPQCTAQSLPVLIRCRRHRFCFCPREAAAEQPPSFPQALAAQDGGSARQPSPLDSGPPGL